MRTRDNRGPRRERVLDGHRDASGDGLRGHRTGEKRQKKSYAKRFAKVLSPTRVARFFQIERKLDAVQNLSVAEQIPLIDQ